MKRYITPRIKTMAIRPKEPQLTAFSRNGKLGGGQLSKKYDDFETAPENGNTSTIWE